MVVCTASTPETKVWIDYNQPRVKFIDYSSRSNAAALPRDVPTITKLKGLAVVPGATRRKVERNRSKTGNFYREKQLGDLIKRVAESPQRLVTVNTDTENYVLVANR